MKIIGEECIGTQDDILKLINKPKPSFGADLQIIKIEENVGWICITGKLGKSEFWIKYSSCMFDTAILAEFFSEIIKLKQDITLFLDNEGSFPLLYAKEINNDIVRFIFAHDYILFENEENDDDCLPLYKVECDIIIDKKTLLKEFYDILYPFTMNYNLKEAYYTEFNIEKGKNI